MPKADSKSTTSKKVKRSRKSVHPKDTATMEEWAATNFEPVDLDLSKTMTNDELGSWMLPVRIAAVHIRMTKPEMVNLVHKMCADESLEDQGKRVFEVYDLMQEAKALFEGLTNICDVASTRLLIACSVLELEEKRAA